jgi:hypothetical protein
MSKKLIIERKNGEPHDPDSYAGIACQVANIWLRRSEPWQTLQAIEPGTKYATVAELGEWPLCEVVVDEQRAEIWASALAPLHQTLESHRAKVGQIGASFAAFSGVLEALANAHRSDFCMYEGLEDLSWEVRSFDLYNLEEKLFDCLEVVFDIQYCQRGLELST